MENLFEGWYFKHDTTSGAISFILGKNNDHAFIQINYTGKTAYITYPLNQYSRATPFYVKVGNNKFSLSGAEIDIAHEDFNMKGTIKYRNVIVPEYDIMGPFQFLPFMECVHSVKAIRLTVSGMLCINGKNVLMDGLGYIEGDCGKSFPKSWIWVQSHLTGRSSLFCAYAKIPFGITFNGLICIFYTGGKEHRFTTYNFSSTKVTQNVGIYHIKINKGCKKLDIEITPKKSGNLFAPQLGDMSREIKESVSADVKVRFSENGKDYQYFIGHNAGFEYMH